MRRRFFVDQFDHHSATLRGQSAEHLGRVLRAQPGQLYELSDGRRVWLARVERVALSKRGDSRIDFVLIEPVMVRESPLQVVVLVAVVKWDRFEWCLEKATEMGAHEIVPLAAARSDKQLISAAERRSARWTRILLESSQQCRRVRPPLLRVAEARARPRGPAGYLPTPQAAFAECASDCRILLSERPNAPAMRDVVNHAQASGVPQDRRTAALAIGPEGGWTDDERVSAQSNAFDEASLGENILRTETAVIAAMAILHFALG